MVAREVGITTASPSVTTRPPTVHTVLSTTRRFCVTSSLTVSVA